MADSQFEHSSSWTFILKRIPTLNALFLTETSIIALLETTLGWTIFALNENKTVHLTLGEIVKFAVHLKVTQLHHNQLYGIALE